MGGPGLSNATYAVQVVLVALAWGVTRRSRDHAAVAVFVSWMTATDTMRKWIMTLRGQAAHPLHGIERAAFHLDELLVSSWSFAFLACCALYFLRGRRIAASILGLWIVSWTAMIATYPWLTGARLMTAYHALFWGTLAVSWTMILFAMFRRRELRPRLAHLVVIMYATSDLMLGAFPFLHGVLGSWQDVRLITLLSLSLCVLFHVNELVRSHRTHRDVTA